MSPTGHEEEGGVCVTPTRSVGCEPLREAWSDPELGLEAGGLGVSGVTPSGLHSGKVSLATLGQ